MTESTVELIKKKSTNLGFVACGITNHFEPTYKNYFLHWLKDSRFAGMQWLNRNTDKRMNPELLLPEARSAIMVAMSYKHEPTDREYKIARYAYGDDYHDWMRAKLDALAEFITGELIPGAKCRNFVDTGPVLERDLAAKAGLGWVGKNTCLINKESGSYLFLGVLFCDAELPVDSRVKDACLTCRLCLDACPTAALTPYQLDPGKCLAYHNIEKRGERESTYWQALGDNLVGCDICQEVCPWNHNAPDSQETKWLESFVRHDLSDLGNILQMSSHDYKTKIKSSAISRIKYEDFMRNVFLVIANTKRADLKVEVLNWRERNPEIDLAEWQHCVGVISGSA